MVSSTISQSSDLSAPFRTSGAELPSLNDSPTSAIHISSDPEKSPVQKNIATMLSVLFKCADSASFFGFMGVTSAVVFSSMA